MRFVKAVFREFFHEVEAFVGLFLGHAAFGSALEEDVALLGHFFGLLLGSGLVVAESDCDTVSLAVDIDCHDLRFLRHLELDRLGSGFIRVRFLCPAFSDVSLEFHFRFTGTISLILCWVHSVLEELLVVFTNFPVFLVHELAIFVERVRIVLLRITLEELASLFLSLLDNLRRERSRQASGFAEDHIPNIVGDHAPTLFALFHLHHVHQGEILDILAEGGYQWRITNTWPNVSDLVEQFDQQLILSHQRLVVLDVALVDAFQVLFQVGHQASHHTTRQSRSDQQGIHQPVFRADVKSKEVVDELLNQASYFHVSRHVDFRYLESGVFQHGLYGEQVSVASSP